jgi:TRAP-type C4-dicarboxylate transport system substrate-binding protein
MAMKMTAAKITILGTLAVSAFVTFKQPAAAQAIKPLTVKLGTLAPSGSSYHTALVEMSQKWRDATGGAVKVTIYPDGTQGGESDMVRMMRAGVLTAGMLTVVGLSDIDPSVGGLSFLPLAFRSWEEFDYVLEKLSPRLEKLLLDKGFVVLFWGDTGWVRFFSKTPALHPDDFKPMKMFTWAGNALQVDMMKSLGYTPVPLETANILPGLRTGLISAIPTPPIQALLGQIYTVASNMLTLKWSVFAGATVIKKDTWDKIPPDAQKLLQDAATQAGNKMRAASRTQDEDAILAMQKKGLKVNTASPQVEEEWRQLTKIIYPQIRGKMVPADIFDEVQRLAAEYRANSKGAGK